MRIISTPAQLQPGSRQVCIAIGFFDGVHLGHQQIIRQTVSDARQHHDLSLAITFDRHPNTIVALARIPPLIYSLPKKLRTIETLELDALLLIPFDESFSRKTGEQFVRELVAGFGRVRSVCVGENFLFGYKRSGNVALLRELGAQLEFSVHGMAAVSLDNEIVSSTRIREAIASGNLDAASQMLGRAYSISGTVVHGDHVGRKLGFPTANLDTTGLVLPPLGVYAALAITGNSRHQAVLNIGFRPTLALEKPALRAEAHLLDCNNDLYGTELELIPVQKLREEIRFDSLPALKEQIQTDILRATSLFS